MKTFRVFSSAALAALAMALIFSTARARAQNSAQESKSAEAPAGNAENGKRDFVKFGCYECHGREAQGSVMTGPRLGPKPVPYETFSTYVRKPAREMPPYTAKVVSDQELADIYSFLRSRPEPPATKPPSFLK
jgi:mono/diheme cytochrome c family protein